MRAEISILSNIYLQESSRLSTTVLLIPALHLARDSKITLRKNGEGSQKPKVKPKANYKDAWKYLNGNLYSILQNTIKDDATYKLNIFGLVSFKESKGLYWGMPQKTSTTRQCGRWKRNPPGQEGAAQPAEGVE